MEKCEVRSGASIFNNFSAASASRWTIVMSENEGWAKVMRNEGNNDGGKCMMVMPWWIRGLFLENERTTLCHCDEMKMQKNPSISQDCMNIEV